MTKAKVITRRQRQQQSRARAREERHRAQAQTMKAAASAAAAASQRVQREEEQKREHERCSLLATAATASAILSNRQPRPANGAERDGATADVSGNAQDSSAASPAQPDTNAAGSSKRIFKGKYWEITLQDDKLAPTGEGNKDSKQVGGSASSKSNHGVKSGGPSTLAATSSKSDGKAMMDRKAVDSEGSGRPETSNQQSKSEKPASAKSTLAAGQNAAEPKTGDVSKSTGGTSAGTPSTASTAADSSARPHRSTESAVTRISRLQSQTPRRSSTPAASASSNSGTQPTTQRPRTGQSSKSTSTGAGAGAGAGAGTGRSAGNGTGRGPSSATAQDRVIAAELARILRRSSQPRSSSAGRRGGALPTDLVLSLDLFSLPVTDTLDLVFSYDLPPISTVADLEIALALTGLTLEDLLIGLY